jgi:hypothetical protein
MYGELFKGHKAAGAFLIRNLFELCVRQMRKPVHVRKLRKRDTDGKDACRYKKYQKESFRAQVFECNRGGKYSKNYGNALP